MVLTATLSFAQLTATGTPLILTDVTVIDGLGGKPQPNMTLVISSGRIVDFFSSGKKPLPAGATVMNLSGRYVIPGLIDSHYHFTLGSRTKQQEALLHRFAFLGGVTSVRDMAGDAIALKELAQSAADGNVQCPRVYFSALMSGATHILNDRRADQVSRGKPRGEVPWARSITSDTDIPRVVAEAKATGATGIKLYTDLTPEIVNRVTAEAHKQGLKVWSHAAIYPGRPSDAVKAGVDAISHTKLIVSEGMHHVPQRYAGSYKLLDYNSVDIASKEISNLLRLMLEKGTFLDPTLLVTSRLEKTEPGEIFRDPKQMADWSYLITLRAHIRRIPIVAGTDVYENPVSRDFPNIHSEMELLVSKVGLTPLEAITAATRNGAQLLGVSDSYGTIAEGKVADLVVLSADPSSDIRNTTSIEYVIKGGVIHQRARPKGNSDNNPASQEELRSLVREWDQATVKGDVAVLDRLLGDEFSFVDGPNKAQYLASITMRPAESIVESAISEDVEVQVFGETATVVGTDTIKGKNRGHPFENRFRYLDVWVKRSGRWQCVKVYSILMDKK